MGGSLARNTLIAMSGIVMAATSCSNSSGRQESAAVLEFAECEANQANLASEFSIEIANEVYSNAIGSYIEPTEILDISCAFAPDAILLADEVETPLAATWYGRRIETGSQSQFFKISAPAKVGLVEASGTEAKVIHFVATDPLVAVTVLFGFETGSGWLVTQLGTQAECDDLRIALANAGLSGIWAESVEEQCSG